MIELQNISFVLPTHENYQKKIIDHLNLIIEDQEFVTLIGANGAGKSTLLKILMGSLIPTSGSIYFDGKDVTHLSVQQRSNYIAYVDQNPSVGTCTSFTVEENLALAFSRGAKRGFSFALTRKKRNFFKSYLDDIGLNLGHYLQEKVSVLSGGQRQALSLAMAVIKPAKILLLDEPTAALDPEASQTMIKLITEIARQYRLTVLMITHNHDVASSLSQRILKMERGKIVQQFREAFDIK